MSSKGVKRASPGADVEKNPLGDVEVSDEEALKLQAIQKDIARVELALGTSVLRKSNHHPPPVPPFASCVHFRSVWVREAMEADPGRVVLQSAARRKRWCPCTRSGARC